MTTSLFVLIVAAVLLLALTLYLNARLATVNKNMVRVTKGREDAVADAFRAKGDAIALRQTLSEVRRKADEVTAAHRIEIKGHVEERNMLVAEVEKLQQDYAIARAEAQCAEFELEKKVLRDDERDDALNVLQGEKVQLEEKVQEQAEHVELLKRQLSKTTTELEDVQGELIDLREVAAKSVPVSDWITGTTELAKVLGVTGKKARHLMKTQGFPAPFHNVGANKLWDRKQINVWKEWQEKE